MNAASLQSLDAIKAYWATNATPIYFVSPTSFNLMDLDRWVNGLRYISYIDTFDGRHPKMLIPKRSISPTFDHLEQINQYLLGHKDVVDYLDRREGKVVFLFFDSELEAMCKAAGLEIWLPPYETVKHVDSKIITTEMGNEAGVASVPNVMAKVGSYAELVALATAHDLGTSWVVQTAYGDSGKTTFFISNESEYADYAEEIEAEDQVKVMRRIRCASAAIEGCTTRCGTFVGPLMSELIGVPELTPYEGGWCGNDLHSSGFSTVIREKAQAMTIALGDVLYNRGYRGYFEVDYLIDLDTHEVYLGELNPRISGITAMTNLSPFSQQEIPLFLIHLTEFSGVPFEVNPSEFNAKSLGHGADGATGQFILKYTDDELKVIEKAPESGVYHLGADGQLVRQSSSAYRSDALGPDQVFLLRIMGNGEYAYHGGDLAILFVNVPLMDSSYQLTPEAMRLVAAFKALYHLRVLTSEEAALIARYQNPGVRFKAS